MSKFLKSSIATVLGAGLVAFSGAASAKQEIANDLSRCAGSGPAALVTVNGLKVKSGVVRVQSYRATRGEWLEKGRWLKRIEVPANSSTIKVCVPVDKVGSYGIAVRHDVNGNGKTDLTKDGGGMSNNPSINIFNLGKPRYDKVAVKVGPGVTPVSIDMKYM